MPRSKKSQSNNVDPVEKIPFRVCTRVTNSVSAGSFTAPNITTFDLTPAIDARLTGIADYFQYYRFSKLSFRTIPNGTNSSAVGYNANTSNTAPTTITDLMSLPKAMLHGAPKTVDSYMTIPNSALLQNTPIKWYQTKPGTEDTEWEVQGQFFYGVFGAMGDTQIVIEGVCEFKGRSPAVMTPLKKTTNPTLDQNPSSPNASGDVVMVAGKYFKLVDA